MFSSRLQSIDSLKSEITQGSLYSPKNIFRSLKQDPKSYGGTQQRHHHATRLSHKPTSSIPSISTFNLLHPPSHSHPSLSLVQRSTLSSSRESLERARENHFAVAGVASGPRFEPGEPDLDGDRDGAPRRRRVGLLRHAPERVRVLVRSTSRGRPREGLPGLPGPEVVPHRVSARRGGRRRGLSARGDESWDRGGTHRGP